jgi:hypothetical protein
MLASSHLTKASFGILKVLSLALIDWVLRTGPVKDLDR